MLRSMYSGVSGMKTNQTKMDVIGNNIANSTTTAFKAGRVQFRDLFSQSQARAQGPSAAGRGGVNPKQVGQGVSVSAIDTLFEGGSMQPTGRDLDLGIEGEGFFVVATDKQGTNLRYTRDGAFYKDEAGFLVNAEGFRLLGDSFQPEKPVTNPPVQKPTINSSALEALSIPNEINGHKLDSFSIDESGLITGIYDDGSVHYLGSITLAKFENNGGLEKRGGNTYAKSLNSGEPIYGTATAGGMGVVRQSCLESSNVDLANEFTDMIVTSRAYQANSRIITTADEMLQELISLKR